SQNCTFALSTILPTYLGGPSILPIKDTKSISLSQGLLWRAATEEKLPPLDFPGWVHVGDVAKAHIVALEKEGEVSGKRWILSEKNASFEKIADIVRANFGGVLNPSKETQREETWTATSSEVLVELGLGSYIPLERTVIETVKQLLEVEAAAKAKARFVPAKL
ncbi:hypothetical protein P7C70_g8457, partial [Phenoliferia sp. Uapishka_3]